MAVYNSTGTDATIPATINLGERNLYGSSRLGVLSLATDSKTLPQNTITSGYSVNLQRGFKFFELSNHLGNVLVTVSDKKIGHTTDGTTVDYYSADVITANDYYPGGMLMPGRKYAQPSSSYRYGFNGKEKLDEIDGEGNAYDFGARILDPRLGRFLSVDPLAKKFPYQGSYNNAENNPIRFIDIEGLSAGDPPSLNAYATPSVMSSQDCRI